ncbi:major capsid protein [Capybara microvirus Cap3_SP_386]|nr:major capsid protein [Capybara microvirus Cap3_SP_386]
MPQGFDKISIKPAVKSRSLISAVTKHITSSDFGQISIPFFTDILPGDKISSLDIPHFSRCDSLFKPTFGTALHKTAGFYVPLHQVHEMANSFVNGETTYMGNVVRQIVFSAHDLAQLFLQSSKLGNIIVSSSDYYDVFFYNSSNVLTKYRFSALGRYYYKILRQLGYNFPVLTSDSAQKSYIFSAYPLLAFAHAYNDWMSSSIRYNNSQLSSLLLSKRRSISSTDCLLNHLDILTILDNIRVCYENDYFTSAWESPESPYNQMGNKTNANGQSYNGDIQYNGSETSLLLEPRESTGGDIPLSARSLAILKSFYLWAKRNNYSGSRTVQRVFSRFGIKSDEFETHYAHLLGTSTTELNIGDVTSLADTLNDSSGERLGQYAGKGIFQSKYHIQDVKFNDHGYFFIFSWKTVRPMYPFNVKSTVLRTSPFDFYTPEMDGIGAYKTISLGEVYTSKRVDNEKSVDTNIFGYTDLYNDYRFFNDSVTGDMELVEGSDVWHFARFLYSVRNSGHLTAQDPSLIYLDPVNSEFNRIFSSGNSTGYDHFFDEYLIRIKMSRPIKNLSGVTELGEGSLSIERNGNELQ